MEAMIGLYTALVLVQLTALILHIKNYKVQEETEIEFNELETYKRFLKSDTMKFISSIDDKRYIE